MIDLRDEKSRLSVVAQAACKDIGDYIGYYQSAKNAPPEKVTICAREMQVIRRSLRRLKFKDEEPIVYDGVEVSI
jgi:hypothetical protein